MNLLGEIEYDETYILCIKYFRWYNNNNNNNNQRELHVRVILYVPVTLNNSCHSPPNDFYYPC